MPRIRTEARSRSGTCGKVRSLDPDLGRFIGPGPGVVQEQQQGMVPTALGRRQVRRREQGIHLRLLQVRDQRPRSLLERHRPHLPAPLDQLRRVQADEPGQGMDRGQPLVPGGDPASPLLLQVAQELSHTVGRHVGRRPGDRSACGHAGRRPGATAARCRGNSAGYCGRGSARRPCAPSGTGEPTGPSREVSRMAVLPAGVPLESRAGLLQQLRASWSGRPACAARWACPR